MCFQILKFRTANFIILPVLLFVAVTAQAQAQTQELEIRLKITAPSSAAAAATAKVAVAGRFSDARAAPKSWSFLQNYADVTNLGARVANLKFSDESGQTLEYKKLAAGEFEAAKAPASFEYEVNAEIPAQLTAAAHVSWLSATRGLLFAGDLLPRNLHDFAAKAVLEMPDGWRAATSENQISEKVFAVKNIGNAVFLVGTDWRSPFASRFEQTKLQFATAGEWQFTDAEAAQMSEQILTEHAKVFGAETPFPFQKAQILLLPFPRPADFDRWRAETRGSTVIILSAPTTFKSSALNRLHEQLRHEIFHLWIPNSLNLSGHYDWFYEGFALYQALKTGVRLNQIRFDDFLSTLGRAYDLAEAISRRRPDVSLLEASERRWINSSGELIYAKGLVAAFLCDAALLRASGGRRDLDVIFREVFQKHRASNQKQDGNAAVIRILKQNAELVSIAVQYIEGNSKIEWRNELSSFGITAEESAAGATNLKVVVRPNGRQKDLLDKLGYNQWRKLLRPQK
jgi:predicted metalloprotease with PDZ domain